MSDRDDSSAANETPDDAADALKRRLRDDLMAAMRARAGTEIAVLRALVAALDNAQAVPIADGHKPYAEKPFGDPSVEVPRLPLDLPAVRALLAQEAGARNAAADQFESLGKTERAALLRSEVRIIARYLET
jgi:uncharacterized protein YqeY